MNATTSRRNDRLVIVDLLAMITLAIGVGIAAAIVLGSAVLLVSGGDSPVVTTGAVVHGQHVTRS